MSEHLIKPEYEQNVSPKENGYVEKRANNKEDLDDFCKEKIVFENTDSILDAVMSVSKVDSTSDSLGQIQITSLDNKENVEEGAFINGYLESQLKEQNKENIVVSEYNFKCTDEEVITNGFGAHEVEVPVGNVCHEFIAALPDVIVGKVEFDNATVNEKRVEEKTENGFILDEEIKFENQLKHEDSNHCVEEIENNISKNEEINCFDKEKVDEILIEEVEKNTITEEIKLPEGISSESLELNETLTNGNILEETNSVKLTENEDTAVIECIEEEEEAGLIDNANRITPEKDMIHEDLIKDETIEDSDKTVLNLIKKKTQSLGRNTKKNKQSSKSEDQINEGIEKSKKKHLFKLFSKDKMNKEGEEVKEDEDKIMSKSFTKSHETKSDKKHFKFFKNVFQKSEKRNKNESGDEVESHTDKLMNGDVNENEKNVSTDNVVSIFTTNSFESPIPPSKLFTINELESEKSACSHNKVIESDSMASQEGYQGPTEMRDNADEIISEKTNMNVPEVSNYYDDDEDADEVTCMDDQDVRENMEGNKEVETADETNDNDAVGDVVLKNGTGDAEVNDIVEAINVDKEMSNSEEVKEESKNEVAVKETESKMNGFTPDHSDQPTQGNCEFSEQDSIPETELTLIKDVKGICEEKTNGMVKKDEEEPKKIKKKNFVLPSFKFGGFSKAQDANTEEMEKLKKEERRSLDDLDQVAKTKKVKKRARSFHFGKKGKKELTVVEESKDELTNGHVGGGGGEGEVGVAVLMDESIKKCSEDDKSELNKSKLSTLKWPRFSKKPENKHEGTENKDKEIKEGKNKKSKHSKPVRQNTLTRGFLKFFSRKPFDTKVDNLNGMVYSLENDTLIASTKALSSHGCHDLNTEDENKSFVVVAIDFGTTFSGYAFSFMDDESTTSCIDDHPIHIMRKWEGGDPGVNNQKTPTIILLTPNQDFHTFGFTARDYYHNLDVTESSKWLYFDKFKMALHDMDIHEGLTIPAANGVCVPALKLFSYALKYFKDHAINELSSQSQTDIKAEDIRWVLTVPAIWKAPAKQFMRKAANMAGITSVEGSNKLLIALEPEAASIYIRRLKRHQLVPDKPNPVFHPPESTSPLKSHGLDAVIDDQLKSGSRYIVVDCGGGTVDLTVHEMEKGGGSLKELYKATGGPYGSTGVDKEFEKLLRDIFGSDFIGSFKSKRPAGWVDLMIAFESRKRTCSPFKQHQHNISMPFSFIDFYKKFSHNTPIDDVVRRHNDSHIRWSPQGMLRLSPEAMTRLFEATIASIISIISNVMLKSQVKGIDYLFLVGGFAESPLLQSEVRRKFEGDVKVIIPQDVSLTILRGAVCYGLDPTVVSLRRSHLTYGIGVVHKFIPGEHDVKKCVRRDGVDWCADVFDGFVKNNQPVALNDSVVRRYATIGKQECVTICVYSSEEKEVKYVTDEGVVKCATLTLKLHVDDGKKDGDKKDGDKKKENGEKNGGSEKKDDKLEDSVSSEADGCSENNLIDVAATTTTTNENVASISNGVGIKQIDAVMTFGDTEIKVTALEVDSGKSVKATIDFFNL